MLKLPESLRDQIAAYLSALVVPAAAGADLMKIVAALRGLEELLESADRTQAPNENPA